MNTLLQDVRYGLRMLLRSPGFTAASVAALALGIGANAAIFSVVNGVLLRPLPYPDPERLTMVWNDNRVEGWHEDLTSWPNFTDWRDQNRSFEAMAGFAVTDFSLTGAGEPERIPGAYASAAILTVLRVEPRLGRAFRPEEDRPGAEPVALIGHALWQRRFGSDPAIVGRPVTLGGRPVTVAGVLPAGFSFPRPAEIWMPIATLPADLLQSRGALWMQVIGRLKPGVPLRQASVEMSAIAARLEQQYPDNNTKLGINLVPLHTQTVKSVRPALLILLAAVAFVLLIACANVANLMLARAVARHKEISIRAAIGAGRGRLVRQLLTESLLLSLAGGTLGILLAAWGVDLLRTLAPAGVPRLEEVGLDGRVLLFAAAVAVLTGILFGLAPALRLSSPDLSESLKEGGRSSTGGQDRLRGALVVGEVALSLILLIGAGLMTRSLLRLLDVQPGFKVAGILTLDINLPRTRYPEDARGAEFFRRLLERVQALPGVAAVAATSDVPLSGEVWPNAGSFTIEGRPPFAPGERVSVNYGSATPGYFRAMGIPLVKGRFFDDRDRPDSARVVLINEAMARRYWPGEDPIGRRMKYGGPDPRNPWMEIVGVVADIRDAELDREARPATWIPDLQSPRRFMTVIVRTDGDPLALAGAVRGEVRALDSDQPVSNVTTMEARAARSLSSRRFNLLLLGLFGVSALLLASLGLYGVMSHGVAQRTREIGIRMALGARAGDVLRLVVGRGLKLALAGVALGVPAALALTRTLTTLLFGVSPTDPITFVAIALMLTGVALLASWIPARRAARVDPMTALRYE